VSKSNTSIIAQLNISNQTGGGYHSIAVVSGKIASKPANIFIQIPTYFAPLSVNLTDLGCPVGATGVGVSIDYQVVDQEMQPIFQGGMTPIEQFTINGQVNNLNYLPFATPQTTSTAGILTDVPVGTCFGPPIPAFNACVDVVQTFKIIVPTTNGNVTYPISTVTSRRDCCNGIRITVTNANMLSTYSFGTIN
jgi:hypothetical protein